MCGLTDISLASFCLIPTHFTWSHYPFPVQIIMRWTPLVPALSHTCIKPLLWEGANTFNKKLSCSRGLKRSLLHPEVQLSLLDLSSSNSCLSYATGIRAKWSFPAFINFYCIFNYWFLQANPTCCLLSSQHCPTIRSFIKIHCCNAKKWNIVPYLKSNILAI